VRLGEGGDLPQQPWGQAADEYEFDRYASTRRERRDLAGRRGGSGDGPDALKDSLMGFLIGRHQPSGMFLSPPHVELNGGRMRGNIRWTDAVWFAHGVPLLKPGLVPFTRHPLFQRQ